MPKQPSKRKRCKKCNKLKPLEGWPWYRNRKGEKILRSECRDCNSLRQRVYQLKKHYNLTVEEYELVLAHQGDVCAICKRNKVNRNLAVDHDHTTGLVRGLLCWACNSFLGKINDDPQIALNAAEYLTNPPMTQALGREVLGQKGSMRRRRRRRK